MLYEFLSTNRTALLEKSADMSALQGTRSEPQSQSYGQISVFLDQLINILRLEESADAAASCAIGAGQSSLPATTMEMTRSAISHGRELRRLGFTIEEVVRNYGGMCQAITTLAIDMDAGIKVVEFRTLNRCLDEAIAKAVVAYTSPDLDPDSHEGPVTKMASRRLDGLAAMFHHAETATSAVRAIRSGRVGMEGATGAVLDRSLESLGMLIQDAIDQEI